MGILLVDKPAGPTSHDVVAAVRSASGVRKVGHAGTLDPRATGLLVVLVGRPATRLADSLLTGDKMYLATARLGVVTETYDLEGDAMEGGPVPDLDLRGLQDVAARFLGPIQQAPPPFSAVKVAGVPAHRRARRGQDVTPAPRRVVVRSFVCTAWDPPDLEFACLVGKGTYVRSLAHDLGAMVGCGACLAALRRIASVPFRVEDSTSLDELRDMSPEDLAAALLPLPSGA